MRKEKDRSMPANIAAEKAILGAVLLENELYSETTVLEADDFSLDAHRRIYLHISEMMESGESVDCVTLPERMRACGDLDTLGESPVAYICDLSLDTIRYRPSVKDWVRIVKAKSLLRRLISVCQSALNKSYDGESGFDIIGFLRENIDEIEFIAKKGLRKNV